MVHNDYAGVLFSSLLMEQGMNEESFLLIDTSFKILKTELDCYLFLIPELKSFEKLIDSLGVCMKKILVVDDAKVVRMVVSQILKRNGYQVIGEAANGREAFEKYKALKAGRSYHGHHHAGGLTVYRD